jgi:mono/diheme cytochrome c family protein
MRLFIFLPLTLTVAAAALACSSSSSPVSPAKGTADAATDSQQQPVADSGTAADSTAPATDSSTPTADSSIQTDSSSPTPDSSTPADAGTLSFATDIYGPIIAHHCTSCHGANAEGDLDMSSADAGFANLVNVTAKGPACGSVSPALTRVVPGSAATSLLYLKVDGYLGTAPPCGSPMPKSGEIPDGGQLIVVDQIQTWINQGAQP